MLFESTIAYTIVTVTALFLAGMSIHNRQSGWRRERSNTLMDLLQSWAEAKAGMRQEGQITGDGKSYPHLSGATIPAMSNQLSALNAALSVDANASPAISAPEGMTTVSPREHTVADSQS